MSLCVICGGVLKKIKMILRTNYKNDSRVIKESVSLSKAGYDVSVLAVHEPSVCMSEVVSGCNVKRLKLFFSRFKRTKLSGALRHLEFVLRAVFELRGADIIHCHDIKPLLPSVIAKYIFFKKIKLVYDAHEHESEVKWLKGWEKNVVRWQEEFLIKFADHVITVSESIATDYAKRYGISKPIVVLNTPKYMLPKVNQRLRNELAIPEGLDIFLYQGCLDYGRGIPDLLEVFKDIGGSCVVFMGDGPMAGRVEDAARAYSNVFYIPAVPHSELHDYTSSAKYGLSMIEDLCLSYRYCLPNKIFEYMMAGIPVLCSDLPEMSRVIRETGAGVVSSGGVEGLKSSIESIRNLDGHELSEACLLASEKYCWERQENTLLRIYQDISV